ncbi:MAG TPA: TIGR03619 family F420-dependent LLM class oxidoreductase [Acidimicrobiales bacterium]|nr:TIGR03619 family F420-dependent LLM class oxidoreductase [Acidimicrobiales bacterium]
MRIGVTAFLTDRTVSPTQLAIDAEERGYYSLYLPEHTHLPVAEARPPALVAGVEIGDYQRSLDPWVALAAAAAVTRRIRLGTGVCLVAQHDPIVLAKQVATLDHLSAGRVVLGAGYGWNRSEAADHGLDFGLRREVAREKLLCVQALWRDDPAQFHGRHVELPPCHSWPKPLQPGRVRTLIGAAAGPRTFAAVAELADGWMPIGGAGVAAALPALRAAADDAGRPPKSVEVVVFGAIPEVAKLAYYQEIGVDEVVLRIPTLSDAVAKKALDDGARSMASLEA